MGFFFIIIVAVIVAKCLWVVLATFGHGSFDKERAGILRRRNFLTKKLITTPEAVIQQMPEAIGKQFQGEWAMYSCSMLSAALVNIGKLYPEERENSLRQIEGLIEIVMSPELRAYDAERWNEDPLESWDSKKSHMSYLSILGWMLSGYAALGGDDKYDYLLYRICDTLHKRMLDSPTLNLPTYPNESVYTPDMLMSIIALSNFTRLYDDRYQSTVNEWIGKAKREWIDANTGLLKSYLSYEGMDLSSPIRGSYSALICYYLTFVDADFAREQYNLLKKHFCQRKPLTGIREYHDRSCRIGFDIDAGPILFNLSPSGTAFAMGPATYFKDSEFRNDLLKTAEIAGSTIRGRNTSHYALADVALVGEAIALAMRTSVPWF